MRQLDDVFALASIDDITGLTLTLTFNPALESRGDRLRLGAAATWPTLTLTLCLGLRLGTAV